MESTLSKKDSTWRSVLGSVTGITQCEKKAFKTIRDRPDIDDEVVIERAHLTKKSN